MKMVEWVEARETERATIMVMTMNSSSMRDQKLCITLQVMKNIVLSTKRVVSMEVVEEEEEIVSMIIITTTETMVEITMVNKINTIAIITDMMVAREEMETVISMVEKEETIMAIDHSTTIITLTLMELEEESPITQETTMITTKEEIKETKKSNLKMTITTRIVVKEEVEEALTITDKIRIRTIGIPITGTLTDSKEEPTTTIIDSLRIEILKEEIEEV
jgi:hypothetical protein